jgi:hypothetical protein
MIAFVEALFSALASIPQILGLVESFASAVTLWWVQRQNNQTLQQIADAAALASRAQTDEDRYKAADAWAAALKRPRVSQ